MSGLFADDHGFLVERAGGFFCLGCLRQGKGWRFLTVEEEKVLYSEYGVEPPEWTGEGNGEGTGEGEKEDAADGGQGGGDVEGEYEEHRRE